MKQERKKIILSSRQKLFTDEILEKPMRDGIELEKGATLTSNFLEKIFSKLTTWVDYFIAYPDIYLDIIRPQDSEFSLFFYQRFTLRILMRFRDVFITAPRAFSKSFLVILALFLQCVFIPGRKVFITANTKQQAAQITKEKIYEIYDHWPLLKKEIIGWELSEYPGNFGRDYVRLHFRNKSVLDVVLAGDAARGGRRHAGLIDEVRDADEDAINRVVIPLVNVSRRLPDNTVNDREINQQIVFTTSAGSKTSFGYERLIETFENTVIDPKHSFMFGCDWRIPAMHGLIDKQYINKLKMSPSYNEEAFSTEYMSLWQGGDGDSWFSYDKLTKHRKIKNPETHAINRPLSEQFYLLSTDVGRLSDSTVVCVFRVNIIKGKFYSTLVNLVTLGRTPQTKPFSIQAIELKKLIEQFNPREVVIDTMGIGLGLADEMIKPHYDEKGQVLPAYGFINDDSYKLIQPKDASKILYGIKANQSLNSKIHGNCYARIQSGMVRFLIKEQEAKSALLATKIGQRMTTEQRVMRLMPHEMTTKLFDEMSNLRLRRTGTTTDVVLERINARFPKDKYSSFSYGLWRIKELEEDYYSKSHSRHVGNRQLVFFTGGK